jgi:hypothetical protein
LETPVFVASTVDTEYGPAAAPDATGFGPSNVLDEAPDAIWYVRPPTGGQYGPAKGDVLRRWIAEGRVSEEALVWREGWADWQLAGPVLRNQGVGKVAAATSRGIASPEVPGLRPDDGKTSPAVARDTEHDVPHPSAPDLAPRGTSPRSAARKKSIALIVVLVFLIVALFAGLVVVLTTRT